jgi:rhodanese-related sulfurtransferase
MQLILLSALIALSTEAFMPPRANYHSRRHYQLAPFAPQQETSSTTTAIYGGGGILNQLLSVFEMGKSAEKVTKEEMRELLETLETKGRRKSKLVVMDVRGPAEVTQTGPLSPSVINLPLDLLENALGMNNADFKTRFGLDKPTPQETLVFSCKSGMRAGKAADLATAAGYERVVVYPGSAMEWFSN